MRQSTHEATSSGKLRPCPCELNSKYVHIVTCNELAWLIIMVSGSADSVYWHVFTIILQYILTMSDEGLTNFALTLLLSNPRTHCGRDRSHHVAQLIVLYSSYFHPVPWNVFSNLLRCRCLAIDVCPRSKIPAFCHHVTIFTAAIISFRNN
jgi:hypothetical protein